MIRIWSTAFAGLLGLAFGSFLNVCVSRWPEGENVVTPRSHCRACAHTLAWWENIPLLSWLALRGHCRNCGNAISWRYPLVELAVGSLWAISAWRFLSFLLEPDMPAISPFLHSNAYNSAGALIEKWIFYWLLIALAALDAENLWLPNWITLPGIGLGIIFTTTYRVIEDRYSDGPSPSVFSVLVHAALSSLLAILAAAGLVLLLRWLYGLIRHREGMGLGDVKLMALLAAWLGLPGTLLAFFIGTMLGAIAGIVVILVPSKREDPDDWATTRLPFGTFLCIGGIFSSLWGAPIIAAYLRWAGF